MMLQRFAGTVEPFASVDVTAVIAWVKAIPLQDWPQQSRHELKPAMVTDLDWREFGAVTEPIVTRLLAFFPNCIAYQHMLSVVMPGHGIEPHCDSQSPQWLCRVHVPLITNKRSRFVVGGNDHRLTVGNAYRVNITKLHAVDNSGQTPRIHFMFDVRSNA